MRIGVDARMLAGPRDGMNTFLREMLTALADSPEKHEFVLYAHRDFTVPAGAAPMNKRIGSGPLAAVGTAWLEWAVPALAQQDGLDVFWGTTHVLPGRLPARTKTVATIHDLVFRKCPDTMPWSRRVIYSHWVPRTLCQADAVVAVSTHVGQDIAALYPVAASKLMVIPEGIERARFLPAHDGSDAKATLEKYNIPQTYLLSVGTLEPRKNLDLLVRAFEEDGALHQRFPLVLAGRKGWKISGLLKQIARSPVRSRIRTIGQATDDELVQLYRAARVCVFTSHYEGCGLPVLEALACGRPVVVPDTAWARETAGRYGYYYVQDNAPSLREKILEAASALVTAQPSADFFAQYSWPRAAQRYLDIFSRLQS